MEPNTQNEQQINDGSAARLGIIAVAIFALGLPLLLAYLFGAWSLTLAAWHLLTAQFTG